MEKKPYKQDGGRCIWLITCSASSLNLTFQMLHTVGIECDECHTVAWRESKYTLIHLNRSKSIRLSKMKKAMANLESTYGVKGSCIMGYETLSSNDKETCVTEHPGFKRMVELLNAKSTDLDSWLREGDVLTNRKGLLWKFIEGTDPQVMTRAQLVDQVRKLRPIATEATHIKAQNENLTAIMEIRTSELENAQKRIDFLLARNENLFGRLLVKTEECAAFKQRLLHHGIDNTWNKRQRTEV